MRYLALAALLLLPPAGLGTRDEYLNAKRKIDLIEADRIPRGSQVTLTSAELNSYVQGELTSIVPDGVRNPKLQLGAGAATGSAIVNFLKLKQASDGGQPGWLMSRLLDGEKEVSVEAQIVSSRGQATVYVHRVEVGGVPLSGGALDFLIRNFLTPMYPEAKIGQPFDLSHGIDRLEVRPADVRVVIGR